MQKPKLNSRHSLRYFRFSKNGRLRLLQMQWFLNSQMWKILKINGLSRLFMCQMCRILDPQNKLQTLEQALNMPYVQDFQNKLQMSEQAPHTAAKRHCVSQSAQLEGIPNAGWVFRVITIVLIYSFVRGSSR